jgi:rod shape-determining protein MreB
MFKQLINNFLSSSFYVQVLEDRLRVVDFNSDREFDQPPFIALEKNNKGQLIVKAIGKDAKEFSSSTTIKTVNPFSHPRQLIVDFDSAEQILRHAFIQITNGKILAPSPKVVIHPMEKLEGGLTQIEIRAFRELCLGAGAREAVVYVGNSFVKQNFNYEEIKRLGL